MLDKQRGNFVFECDVCHAVLETNCADFGAAQNFLRRSGWKPRKTGEEWEHHCDECK